MNSAVASAAIDVKNVVDASGCPCSQPRGNPDFPWQWQQFQLLGESLSPVAMSVHKAPLTQWERLPLKAEVKKFSYSVRLRLYYRYLHELCQGDQTWKIGFMTVNFSAKVTERLVKQSRGSKANAYANQINVKLRQKGIDVHWFTVLEDKNGNLHSHSILAYHPQDEEAIKAIFGQDTDNKTSGMRLQHTYKQRKKRNSKRQDDVFPFEDAFGPYRFAPIDIGSADYISKDLEKSSNYLNPFKGRISASRELMQWAESQYKKIRKTVQRYKNLLRNRQDAEELTNHQLLTLLYREWVPTREPDDYSQDDDPVIEEYRDRMQWQAESEPGEHDWQYEEEVDDPVVEEYWARLQWHAEPDGYDWQYEEDWIVVARHTEDSDVTATQQGQEHRSETPIASAMPMPCPLAGMSSVASLGDTRVHVSPSNSPDSAGGIQAGNAVDAVVTKRAV